MKERLASTKILIVDDEPEYLKWVVEFVESLQLKPRLATSLVEALRALDEDSYRFVLIDMNVPGGGTTEEIEKAAGPFASYYKGLVVANRCRNMGYKAHQVIAYTVHDDEAIGTELEKLNCRYVLKGRPEALKNVIRSSITVRTPKKR